MDLLRVFLVAILIGTSLAAPGKTPSESTKDFRHRQNRDGVDYFRCVQNGTIAITFDDGPRPGMTDEMIAALRTLDVPATFFVAGNMGYGNIYDPASQLLILESVTNGNSIGSHTWSHTWPGLDGFDESIIIQEMHRLSNALTLILGKTPTIMRPPFGSYNEEVIRIVNGQLGYKLILWSIDTNDWQHPGDTAAGVAQYEQALGGTIPSQTPGFIALHHDPLDGSVELATAAINYARGQGYRFVSLQECLDFDI